MSDLNALLAQIHEGLARDLLSKIKSGEATAADLSVARQFLKDNAIQAKPVQGSPPATSPLRCRRSMNRSTTSPIW
ncbi:MAG: hypothetical protein ACT4QA_16475 [Panacagrimonas sp.]